MSFAILAHGVRRMRSRAAHRSGRSRGRALGIVGSRRVETIALQECDRRAGGAVGRNGPGEFGRLREPGGTPMSGLLSSALVLMAGWITASDPRLVVDVDQGLCPLGGGTPFSVRLGRLWSACGTSRVGGVLALALAGGLGGDACG